MGARSFVAKQIRNRAIRKDGDPAELNRQSWEVLLGSLAGQWSAQRTIEAIQDIRPTLDTCYERVKACYEKSYVDCERTSVLQADGFEQARDTLFANPGLASTLLQQVLARYEWRNPSKSEEYLPGTEPERAVVNIELGWMNLISDSNRLQMHLKEALQCLTRVRSVLVGQLGEAEWITPPDYIGEAGSFGPGGPGEKYYQLGLDLSETAGSAAVGLGSGILMGQIGMALSYIDAIGGQVGRVVAASGDRNSGA